MTECPKCGGTDIAMILYGLPQMTQKISQRRGKEEENCFLAAA